MAIRATSPEPTRPPERVVQDLAHGSLPTHFGESVARSSESARSICRDRYRMRMRMSLLIPVGVTVLAMLGLSQPASATGGEGEAWPSFTESSSCGAQRVITPNAEDRGSMAGDELLRGEFAAMFGRTVDQVRLSLVRWEVPGSSEVLTIHDRALPAFERAASNLEASLAAGAEYRIDPASTFAAAARTIGGNSRISRHTFGIAIDVNSRSNPNRSDNTLVTDLPDWWVNAFLDAGFCWGGLWIGSKDAMHFAWQGPAFSGYDALPLPYEPLTDAVPFTSPSATIRVVPTAPWGTFTTVLADADGNGALDVVRLADSDDGLVVDASVASRRHDACSSRRSLVAGFSGVARDAHTVGFGDWDGRGGKDLWAVSDDDGVLRLIVRWKYGGYSAEMSAVTSVPTPSEDAWVSTGDYDGDGHLDLFVVDGDRFRVWSVDPHSGATAILLSTANPMPGASVYFLGDADLDLRPDLWGLGSGALRVATASDGYARVADEYRPTGLPQHVEAAAASDYDGDGRADLVIFDGFSKRVWLGNSRLPDALPLEVWFEVPPEENECEAPLVVSGPSAQAFSSSGRVAKGSYEWRSAHGFAVGCDPEDEGCESPIVTGTSLAEYFSWVDGLSPASGDADLAAARAVVRAGYELPCTLGNQGCWGEPVLRTAMSYYFGRFLDDRRGGTPQPHRWVRPEANLSRR